jgi:integrase
MLPRLWTGNTNKQKGEPMRGSIAVQCGRLSVEVNEIGKSKADAVDEARIELAEAGIPATAENIAELTGIYGAGTMTDYMQKWQELGNWAKDELGVKDFEKLDGEAIRQFLAEKMELGVSYSHFSGYCAAFGKLENALESFSASIRGVEKDYGFREAINSIRSDAREELPRFEGTRAYSSTENLLNNLSGTSELVARIQLESGARLSEASNITASQLRGMSTNQLTDRQVGQFEFVGKGGRENVGNLSPETYQQLSAHINEHGSLSHSVDIYREDLKHASAQSNQDYTGSHGLRWNFAQDRMQELQSAGVGHTQSLGQVSSEMGHNRIEITNHYLGN